SAVVEGQQLLIGTRRLMNQHRVDVDSALQRMNELEDEGKTAMLVAVNGTYAATIAVADTIKETSKRAVSRLQDLGIRVIMMTGDNERTAHAIAHEAGISDVFAEVLPEGKA